MAHGWHSSRTVIEVVTDDMPFLVDSLTAELNYQGVTVHLVIHPIFSVTRNARGLLTDWHPAASDEGKPESFMHIEVSEPSDPAVLARLTGRIEQVLEDVRAAVEDWPKMKANVGSLIEELAASPPRKIARDEITQDPGVSRMAE